MTAQRVDETRVQRALAQLDWIAAEHPELTEAEARRRLDAWIAAEEEGEEDSGPQAGEPKK